MKDFLKEDGLIFFSVLATVAAVILIGFFAENRAAVMCIAALIGILTSFLAYAIKLIKHK